MEILKNFTDDTFELIASGENYVLPNQLNNNDVIRLSVFTEVGSFISQYILEQNKDFYIKNEQIFLKPNEVLDRNNFTEGNYTLQFDFVKRYSNEDLFYVSQISPSRQEIRLKLYPLDSGPISKPLQNSLTEFFNDGGEEYSFNSFLELPQGRILAITNYAFDKVTDDSVSLILKFHNQFPLNIDTLTTDFKIVNKFLASLTRHIFYR